MVVRMCESMSISPVKSKLPPAGFSTGVIYNIVAGSNALFLPFSNPPTNTIPTFGATGKVSGTMLADGVVVKEQDLLNGLYYMNIHTAANGGGEIRAQIEFQ